MNLKILLPAEIFLSEEVTKVVAEAENGFFCLLPQHVDFHRRAGAGCFFLHRPSTGKPTWPSTAAPSSKRGSEVLVSTRNAVKGPELGDIQDVVIKQFEEIDEREKKARSARGEA